MLFTIGVDTNRYRSNWVHHRHTFSTQSKCPKHVLYPLISFAKNYWQGQQRRISLPVQGASYELLIPFRGYSAELKREHNQRSLSWLPHARAERAGQSFRDDSASTPSFFPTRTQTTRQYVPGHQYALHTTYKGRGNPVS